MPGPASQSLRSSTRNKVNSFVVKSFSHRVPFLQREKAAYAILRRKGLSMNLLAEAFGRSTSVIHRVLHRLQRFGHNLDPWCRSADLRKLPYQARMRMASFRRYKLFKLLSYWEAWICGEEEEPP